MQEGPGPSSTTTEASYPFSGTGPCRSQGLETPASEPDCEVGAQHHPGGSWRAPRLAELHTQAKGHRKPAEGTGQKQGWASTGCGRSG